MGFYSVVEKNGQKTIANLAGATRGEGCPLGSIIAYPSDTLPNDNWLFCDGSTFDETKYPALYLLLGSNTVPKMNKIIKYDYTNPQTFPGNGEINWTATSDGLFYPFLYASSGNAYSAYITINGSNPYAIPQANSNQNSAVFELKKGDVIRLYGDWSSRTDAKFIPAITCKCIIKATSNMNESEATGLLNIISQRESYSTEEVNTGKKWIDGKPIYRKCMSLSNAGTVVGDWTTFVDFLVDMNVEQIVKGSFKRRNDNAIIEPEGIKAVNNNLQFQVYTNWGVFDLAILEYTKTTD